MADRIGQPNLTGTPIQTTQGANSTQRQPVPTNVLGQVGTIATNAVTGGNPLDSASRSGQVTTDLDRAAVTSASNGEHVD